MGVLFSGAASGVATPQSVTFPSRDGATRLAGYLYVPDTPGPHPGIVLLHGRSGLYSERADGRYAADTLAARHRAWAEFWAARGYVALLVDSFGPRGHPAGFPRGSYSRRPAEVSEQLVRPLDAYGALDYLRTRAEVIADRVGVQGWSNGGMTVLSALGRRNPALADPTPERGFRAGIAQYPGCGAQQNDAHYAPYAPLLLTAASDDDEVSPERCRRLAEALRGRGADVVFVLYEGAQHAYDSPGRVRQSHAPNRAAFEDTRRRAEVFFGERLRP